VNTRDKLVAAAIELFSSSGFDRTSVREIERRAQVNRGLVAYHFSSKDSLWRAAVDELMLRFHHELTRHGSALRGVDAVERGRVLLRIFVRFQAACPEYTRFIVAHGDDRSDRMRWLADQYLRRNLEFFRSMIGEQERYTEDDAISHFIVSGAASLIFAVPAYCELVFNLDTQNPDFIDRFADIIADMFVDLPMKGLPAVNSARKPGAAAAASDPGSPPLPVGGPVR
jgi:AcrR family transcriptional regulator